MHSTAALMLANGHIGDLMADATRERRANLVRPTHEPTGRGRTRTVRHSNPARWILRVVRVTPRAIAR